MRPRRCLSVLLMAVVSVGAASEHPASVVRPWVPAGVSSGLFESHPAFDPVNGDLYFVRSSKSFSGWRILTSHCDGQAWTAPVSPSFAGAGIEADPWFTPDGRSLYFISSRASAGMRSRDLDIWRVDRKVDGHWGTPMRLPAPVNTDRAEWFPRLAADGWLYFGSDRSGGAGGNDIWRARKNAHGRWTVENVKAVNTAGNEYEPLPSPDGRRMIVMAEGGLHESRWGPAGWSARVKLGPQINANGSEIGALFSPSGKSLLFARDTGEPESGEFFVWHIDGHESWPPSCGGVER